MTAANRGDVRSDLRDALTLALPSAQEVLKDQPNTFEQSPTVVVASGGSGRPPLTLRGAAPAFYIDIYAFVLATVGADDYLDKLDQELAQFVTIDGKSGPSWLGIGYDGRSRTTFVTTIDGREWKKEYTPLVLQGRT